MSHDDAEDNVLPINEQSQMSGQKSDAFCLNYRIFQQGNPQCLITSKWFEPSFASASVSFGAYSTIEICIKFIVARPYLNGTLALSL